VKRIAAVAALIVGMLAIPAAAMASTNNPGPGSGYGQGQWGQGQYCQPGQFHHPYGKHHRHHRHHPSGFNNCAYPPPQPSGYCSGQSFTFTWATDSNSLFEESGPPLYSGEQFTYDGNAFTIGTVNQAAGSITLTTVNYGPTIFYGVGYLC
jgi:hypothetical protein